MTGSYFKWHPLFSLVAASLAFGLLAGLPLGKLPRIMGEGFGSLVGNIGLIVVLGSILGIMLEGSGSVKKLGDFLQSMISVCNTVFFSYY